MVFGLGQVKLSELKAKEARYLAEYYHYCAKVYADLAAVLRGLGDLYERYAERLLKG